MVTQHPWHDVSAGENIPQSVNMIVEIGKDSKIKYELDKESGLLKLDRYMFSPVHYPADYGFIPQTLWEDGDPLDILVITHRSTIPLTLCEVKPIGVLRMIDSDEKDDKIIAVHAHDPRFAAWNSLDDIPQHFLKELKHFFETYKELQGKIVKVYDFLGPEDAWKDIQKGIDAYQEAFTGEKL